jgi:hypothetical protein
MELLRKLPVLDFIRHHSPFATSYSWFTISTGYWLTHTSSPAARRHILILLYFNIVVEMQDQVSVFRLKVFMHFLVSLKHAAFPDLIKHLDFSTTVIFGEEKKL